MKKIGLMDCNNFFVSCERLFRPDLKNKPVAVLSSNDGVIVARSNELKDMGVPMGVPLFQAKEMVDMSKVTLFSSNFTLYRDISKRVMTVLEDEVGTCEKYSVDEAFFEINEDVDESFLEELRSKVMQKTGIPVSVGASSTKTLAKVASELNKKSTGFCLLDEKSWLNLALKYPCNEVWNLGRATAKKLRSENILYAYDFMQLSEQYVQSIFGIQGRRIQDELRGKSVLPINTKNSEPKSITSSRTFAKETNSLSHLESALSYHISVVAEKMRVRGLKSDHFIYKIRTSRHGDWFMRSISGEVLLEDATNDTRLITKEVIKKLSLLYEKRVPYKKAEFTAVSLVGDSFKQMSLFNQEGEKNNSSKTIGQVLDDINFRFGKNSLKIGTIQSEGPRTMENMKSQAYTTRWSDIPKVKAK